MRRRSARARGGAARRRERSGPRTPYRRPTAEAVRDAALSVVAAEGTFASQAALRRAVLRRLRRREPSWALGGRRLRLALIGVPGVALAVQYAELDSRRPLTRCPVCGSELTPIRNATLFDDRVTVGYRCARCGYWTARRRRVPVRYGFRATGGPPRVAELTSRSA